MRPLPAGAELATGASAIRVAKGIVSKVLKTDPTDGGQQWTVDNYERVREAVETVDASFGRSGYKSLAICVQLEDGPMQFAGLLPILDPPRKDTEETLSRIRSNGVKVKMVTGDHLNIAKVRLLARMGHSALGHCSTRKL